MKNQKGLAPLLIVIILAGIFVSGVILYFSLKLVKEVKIEKMEKERVCLEQFLTVTTGGYLGNHSLAIKTDGTLWAWGDNHNGQLGDGTQIDALLPKQIDVDTDWKMVATANDHSLAIKTDGTLWVWGDNHNGQLGDGAQIDALFPKQIDTDNDWEMVATANDHSLAIKTDGTLWAWGDNDHGQLGIDCKPHYYLSGGYKENCDRKFPVRIGADTDWKIVSVGRSSSFAIKTDGTLWAWGYNYFYQLGDRTRIDALFPKQIDTDINWKMVSAGGSHSLAIKTDGTLWAWGQKDSGQLGDGKKNNAVFPRQIDTDTDWKMVSAGGSHSLAIKTDGTLWAWGYNHNGQLGIGCKPHYFLEGVYKGNCDREFPVRVGRNTDWKIITAGSGGSFGIKADGTLWRWGGSYVGTVDYGVEPYPYSPRQICTTKSNQ
jgi:alpha-tubulin suppressor-like RCC1 family protein